MHAASLGNKAAFTLTTTGARKSEMTCNTSESIKQKAFEKIQPQWNTCLEERRKKYEKDKVASNLNYTQQNSEGRIFTQLNNNDLHNRAAIENDRSGEIRTGKAKNAEIRLLTEKTTQKRTTNVSIVDGVTSEKAKTPRTTQELHIWKSGTILITGESMLHWSDERRMSKKWLSNS